MSRKFFSIGLVAFALGLGAAAAGETKKPMSTSPRGECQQDLGRFCANTPFGQGRRLVCLARHKAQLTPACRDKLAFMQSVFEYGQKQHERTQALIKKMEADEKNKSAHAPAPPPPAKPK